MRIQHNIMSMNAYRNYTNNTSAMQKNLERLSSGYKINRAGDDAAGLAISEKMRAQITGLEVAQKNAKDGISLVQTAEGALTEVHDMLNRMVELAEQSANGTYGATDRAALQQELTELKDEINRIAKATNFNGIKLLNGDHASKSISALGDLFPESLLDGIKASEAGAATATITLGKAAATDAPPSTDDGKDTPQTGDVTYSPVTASTEEDETYDGSAPSAATKEKITFTLGASLESTGNAANVFIDTAAGGYEIHSSNTDIAAFVAAMKTEGWNVSIKNGSGNPITDLSSGDFAGGETITLEAISAGKTGLVYNDGTPASNYIQKGDKSAAYTVTVDQVGYNEGEATTPAKKEEYELTLDLTKLEGGQTIKFNGKTLHIENLQAGATGDGASDFYLNIWGIDLSDIGDDQTGDGGNDTTNGANGLWTKLIDGGALETALGNVFDGFDVTVDYNDTDGTAKITLKAQADSTDLSEVNSGEIEFGNANGKSLLASETEIKHTPGVLAGENPAEGKVAQAVYESEDLAFTDVAVGTKIKINGVEFEIVEDEDKDEAANKISVEDFASSKIEDTMNALLKKAFVGSGINAKYEYTGAVEPTPAKGKITLTGTQTADKTLDALKTVDGTANGPAMIQIGTAAAAETPEPKPETDPADRVATDTSFKIGDETLHVGSWSELKAKDSDSDGTPDTPTKYELVEHEGSTVQDLINALKKAGMDQKYNVTINDKKVEEMKDDELSAALKAGDVIEFKAKMNGKMDADEAKVFDDIKLTTTKQTVGMEKNSDGVETTNEALNAKETVSEIVAGKFTNGWDEGETGAGARTKYTLTVDPKKVAGGQTFIFGTGETVYEFEFDLDGDSDKDDTDNNTVADENRTELGAKTREKIALTSGMSDEEMATAIEDAIKKFMTDFNVTANVVDGKIQVDLEAKEGNGKFNLGQVRFDTEAGSMTGTYSPYKSTVNGQTGAFPQASWDFDVSKLKEGDILTIAGVDVEITAEMLGDTSKIVQAFEANSADEKGFSSFTGRIEIADGKLTITGTDTSMKGEELAEKYKPTLTRDGETNLVTGGLTLQIGDTADEWNQITVSIAGVKTTDLEIDGIMIDSQKNAMDAVDVIKTAIDKVSEIRGKLGATQNRLDHTINNLSVMTENIQDAESTIRDTDIAEEMMAYTKNNILIQAAQAMLAQANQVPQGVLQLLQ